MKISNSNDVYKYSPDEIYDYIYELERKLNKAIELLIEYNMPCEMNDFMNKNVDYCSSNCGVDEEVREMIDEILKRLELSDNEKEKFTELKEKYHITDKLFYKEDFLYSIKILYKNNTIFYQLKRNRKIILETKNITTIRNKIEKILNR